MERLARKGLDFSRLELIVFAVLTLFRLGLGCWCFDFVFLLFLRSAWVSSVWEWGLSSKTLRLTCLSSLQSQYLLKGYFLKDVSSYQMVHSLLFIVIFQIIYLTIYCRSSITQASLHFANQKGKVVLYTFIDALPKPIQLLFVSLAGLAFQYFLLIPAVSQFTAYLLMFDIQQIIVLNKFVLPALKGLQLILQGVLLSLLKEELLLQLVLLDRQITHRREQLSIFFLHLKTLTYRFYRVSSEKG